MNTRAKPMTRHSASAPSSQGGVSAGTNCGLCGTNKAASTAANPAAGAAALELGLVDDGVGFGMPLESRRIAVSAAIAVVGWHHVNDVTFGAEPKHAMRAKC